MNPMIKYRGGKSKEIKNFTSYIPKQYNTYIEPFFGGGGVFFYLNPKKAIISDINEKLIGFYKEMKTNYILAKKQLDQLHSIYEKNQLKYENQKKRNPNLRIENKNETLYYQLRDMFNNKTKSEYLDSVLYYFINKTAYSGMIRYNSNGEYNVPFGRYKNFNVDLISEAHIDLLKRTKIICGDFSNTFNLAKNDDFMFLDPPYDCIFNDYGNLDSEQGFDENEHRRLASDFRNLNCKALMIIGETRLTKELYKEFVKGKYHKSYAVNIRNRFKSKSNHLIISNY